MCVCVCVCVCVCACVCVFFSVFVSFAFFCRLLAFVLDGTLVFCGCFAKRFLRRFSSCFLLEALPCGLFLFEALPPDCDFLKALPSGFLRRPC